MVESGVVGDGEGLIVGCWNLEVWRDSRFVGGDRVELFDGSRYFGD